MHPPKRRVEPSPLSRRRNRPRPASRVPVSTRPVLDPHGLYGTRTAQRRRAVRRRRQFQNGLLSLCFAFLVAFLVWRWQFARTRSATSSLHALLRQAPSCMPLQTQNALLVPVFDGRLLSLKTNSNVATAIFTADFSLRTSPVALENDVVVTAENGGVLRLAQNGKIVWQWRANVSVSTRPLVVRVLDVASQSSMTQSETSLKMLVVGDDNGEVTALNARDGKVVWTQKTGAPIGNALAASSDGKWVFVPLSGDLRNRGAVVCLNAQSGTVRWTKEVGASCVAAPVVGATSAQGRDERVFLCADNGSVLCLDKSGKSVWKTFVRPLPNAKNDEAIVLRGESLLKLYGWGARLFVGGNDGVLRCLDARSGRELWNFETGAPLLQRAFSLQIAQNDAARAAILVGAKTRLCALDAKSGALLWSAPTQDEIAFWSARDKTAWSVSRAGVAERFSLP